MEVDLEKNSLISLYYESEDYFFRSLSKKCLDFPEGTAYRTEVEAKDLNPVYFKKLPPSFGSLRIKIESFFASTYGGDSLDFVLGFPQEAGWKAQESILKREDYSFTGSTVTMVLRFKEKRTLKFKKSKKIQMLERHLYDWMIPLSEAFKTHPKIVYPYLERHEQARADKKDFYHFVAYEGNNPVSSLTLSLQGKSARIDDLGTIPSYQNQGYATSLMFHALAEAQKREATYCFLEASTSGLSLYEKLGFKSLFQRCFYSLG